MTLHCFNSDCSMSWISAFDAVGDDCRPREPCSRASICDWLLDLVATTNAIAAEAGVSPATLYQFFPSREALASELASMYARQMAEAERAIDSEGVLSFTEAVGKLIDVCISFNRKYPEFHTLVVDAPLSPVAREDKRALGQVFVDFIKVRLRRELPTLSQSEATHHGQVALMIFRGILDELTVASPNASPRLRQAMRNAVLRYLTPILTESKAASQLEAHRR
jgi:AcrR family transcriptional regulator